VGGGASSFYCGVKKGKKGQPFDRSGCPGGGGRGGRSRNHLRELKTLRRGETGRLKGPILGAGKIKEEMGGGTKRVHEILEE